MFVRIIRMTYLCINKTKKHMNHPTKSQVQTVIDTLKKSLKIVGNGLDMSNPNLFDTFNRNICGTFLCHGGHYAIGKGVHDYEKYDYSEGADLMAKDLGFEEKFDLKMWPKNNSLLWGNDGGESMFIYGFAFANDKNPNGAETLEDIIYHWEQVQKRLPE